MTLQSENIVNYYLSIPLDYKNFLGDIRSFAHLTIGTLLNTVWVKGFSQEEIESNVVRAIPYITRFYEKDNRLFRLENHLPDCKIPSVQWSPIGRGLSIELPKENFNFSGIHSTSVIEIIAAKNEADASALKVCTSLLIAYLKTAPKARLDGMKWVMIDDFVIVLGKPLFPLAGEAFWSSGNFLFPAGYSLNQMHFLEMIEKKIDHPGHYILWEKDKKPVLIPKASFKSLSAGSFKLTLPQFS